MEIQNSNCFTLMVILQAFVYVGLYGYSYIEAGKNVITLFKNRGWEAIIADDLISNGK